MWKRWGTPPDTTGSYTSGFQEEFSIARAHYEKFGRPELKMYFKSIDSDALQDPGEGLKRVLQFKAELTSRKDLFYEHFDNLEDFRRRFTRAITLYVKGLHERDANADVPTPALSAPTPTITVAPDVITHPLAAG